MPRFYITRTINGTELHAETETDSFLTLRTLASEGWSIMAAGDDDHDGVTLIGIAYDHVMGDLNADDYDYGQTQDRGAREHRADWTAARNLHLHND